MATSEEAAEIIVKLALFYNFPLDEKIQLPLYARALMRYDRRFLEAALEKFCDNPENDRFPIPPQKIVQELTGRPGDDDAKANEVASLIRDAITKYGCGIYLDDQQRGPFIARIAAHIGDVGMAVVSREGGWEQFCTRNNTGTDARIMHAQLRDIAKSVLAAARAGTLGKAPELPRPAPLGQLEAPTMAKKYDASKLVSHAMKSIPPGDRDDEEECL